MSTTETPSIEVQITELEAAGWTPWRLKTVWQSPSGRLHFGPHGAWKAMRFRRDGQPEKVQTAEFCDGPGPCLNVNTEQPLTPYRGKQLCQDCIFDMVIAEAAKQLI